MTGESVVEAVKAGTSSISHDKSRSDISITMHMLKWNVNSIVTDNIRWLLYPIKRSVIV